MPSRTDPRLLNCGCANFSSQRSAGAEALSLSDAPLSAERTAEPSSLASGRWGLAGRLKQVVRQHCCLLLGEQHSRGVEVVRLVRLLPGLKHQHQPVTQVLMAPADQRSREIHGSAVLPDVAGATIIIAVGKGKGAGANPTAVAPQGPLAPARQMLTQFLARARKRREWGRSKAAKTAIVAHHRTSHAHDFFSCMNLDGDIRTCSGPPFHRRHSSRSSIVAAGEFSP